MSANQPCLALFACGFGDTARFAKMAVAFAENLKRLTRMTLVPLIVDASREKSAYIVTSFVAGDLGPALYAAMLNSGAEFGNRENKADQLIVVPIGNGGYASGSEAQAVLSLSGL